jgi:hypothetical protein
MDDLKRRDFQKDFCAPAIAGLSRKQALRVGIALDCAIAFGALEAQQGNESLKDSPQLEAAYWDKVMRLKGLGFIIHVSGCTALWGAFGHVSSIIPGVF